MPAKYVEAMVLDPYAFTSTTMCSHCGDVPLSKVIMRNKKSAADMVALLRKEAPMSFKLVRFFIGVRIAFAVIAVVTGVIVWAVAMDFPSGALCSSWLRVAHYLRAPLIAAFRRPSGNGMLW
ncbi:MAG: hypothetical protein U0936_27935 [Planctomycetaceae bacterium]